jgi:hypothetical protein
MKKLLFSILAAFSFSASQAQLDPGCKAVDFTFTALNNNGQLVNLYSWLDSGKYVILDVSATWCGPCWNYHNTHAMKDLYTQYGPGTAQNLVRCVFVEGDGTTGDNLMSGGAGSQGNWLSGTPYPMCNPAQAAADQFNNDYEIGYFPTVYLICPDRTVKEVGQMTAAQLWAEINPTPQCAAKINVDATPVSVTGKLISCTGTFAIDLTLKNRGFNALTACTITAKNGATVVGTQNWSGNLSTYQTANTTLNLTGVNNYDSLVIEVTAAGDQIPANNSFTLYIDNYTAANASTLPYNENMDGGTKMPAKLGFENVGAMNMFGFYDGINGTTKLKGANGSDTKGVFVNFYNTQSGTNAILTLGNFNTNTASTYLYLDFDVAGAPYSAAAPENDKLEVVVSTDCGTTWTSKWSKSGNTLYTAPATTSSFIPSAAGQWRHETVDISSIKNDPNAIVALKATSDYGNYAWIDNIKVAGSGTPSSVNNINEAAVDIYPNPAISSVNIRGIQGKAQISLLDVLGRTVIAESFNQASGEFQMNVTGIKAGNYIIRITQEGQVITRSIAIGE